LSFYYLCKMQKENTKHYYQKLLYKQVYLVMKIHNQFQSNFKTIHNHVLHIASDEIQATSIRPITHGGIEQQYQKLTPNKFQLLIKESKTKRVYNR